MSIPLRPMTDTTAGTCDWGGCDDLTVAERYFPDYPGGGQWLGVCDRHARPDRPGMVVCVGRDVTDQGQPTGDECGATLIVNRGDLLQRARAAGWAVTGLEGVDRYVGMCPRCRRPPAAAVALARERDKAARR